jgi:hypothetical protein
MNLADLKRLAESLSPGEISQLTGLSLERISRLIELPSDADIDGADLAAIHVSIAHNSAHQQSTAQDSATHPNLTNEQ